MDFGLNDDQLMLKDTAEKFFAKECPKSLVRELREKGQAHSPATWGKMADLGWMGLPFPEEFGGVGMQFIDLAVILEEMGRSVIPSPFVPTILLGGYPILELGTGAQKADLLPRIAEGKLIATMALLEDERLYDPSAIRTTAVPEGTGFVLDGLKLFVPSAEVADVILTVARTPGAGAGEDTIFLVDPKSPGLRCDVLPSIDASGICELTYSGVRVPSANVLGEVGGTSAAISRALARAAIAECLQMLGAGEAVLEMSVDHAKNRVQFDVPIGSFQAVKHHVSNMSIDLKAMRLLTYRAAWMISEGLPCDDEVAACKALVGDAARRVILKGHQIHGGGGFILEHDMPLYFFRTIAASLNYGDSNYHYRALEKALDR